jgi:hypothetical protein
MNNAPQPCPAADAVLPLFDAGVSLVCWAYNEEALIGGFLDRAGALMDATCADYEIVVIDDCSTDATNAIIREKAAHNPKIKLYRNDVNRNVGYSCRRAISLATKQYLFWQTVDWSYDIDRLRAYLELLKTNDVVLGVRRAPTRIRRWWARPFAALLQLLSLKHLTSRSDTVRKAAVSICNYVLIRLLFQVPLSDYQNVVFYKSAHIQAFTMESDSSFINPELLLKSHWLGRSIVEVPIDFLPRAAGEAKGTRLKAITKSVRDVFTFWLQWKVLGRCPRTGAGRIVRLDPRQWEQPERTR